MHFFSFVPKTVERHWVSFGQYPHKLSSDVHLSFEFVHSPSMHLEPLMGCASGLSFWFSVHASPSQHSSLAQHSAICFTLSIGAKVRCVLSAPSVGIHFSV